MNLQKNTYNNMEYYKTEEGKLVHYLIHEHNNGIGIISNAVRGLEFRLDNKLPIEEEDLRKIIEWVRSGIKRSNDGVDYLYEKLKERHKNIEQ